MRSTIFLFSPSGFSSVTSKKGIKVEAFGQKTVLIVDEVPIFRQTLAKLIKEKGIASVVLETGSAQQAKAEIAVRSIQMIILDLSLPDHQALRLLEYTKQQQPACRGVMLLKDRHSDELMAAIRLEADGFLTKKHEADEMLELLEKAMAGQMVISDSLTNVLAVNLRSGEEKEDDKNTDCLTSREQEVLGYIASGMSNKAIASRLSITDGTVKVHVKHMLKKLGFRSRVEAAVWASERGFRNV